MRAQGMKGRGRRCKNRRFRLFPLKLSLHPLFWLVGVWYCLTGRLFLFLMSCFVALQHECAHAFAAAKLGYKLNRIVLMPFGAVIDGDLRGISLKDEITVAVWGPLCNLLTALFFVALWWLIPDWYAFTDTACYASLAIALVNLLPAYPLDGGRIFRCALTRALARTKPQAEAQRIAERVAKWITFAFVAALVGVFAYGCTRGQVQISLCTFAVFLFTSGLGNHGEDAIYARMDFSTRDGFLRGLEIKRVAVSEKCAIKDVFRHLTRGAYLVLEVYDERENYLFDLSQNEFSEAFLTAQSPYTSIGNLPIAYKKAKKVSKNG